MNFRELTQRKISEIIVACEAIEHASPSSEEHQLLTDQESQEQQLLNELLDDLTKTALNELEALMLYGRADTDDSFREILLDTHGPEQREAQTSYILGKQGSLSGYLRTGLKRLKKTGETIGPRSYADLTNKEQERVLSLYYDSEIPIQTIIDQYEINCTPGRLSKQFPPLKTNELCPHCKVFLVQRRPSRTRSGIKSYQPVCEKCGHGKRNPCRCKNCNDERKRATQMDLEEKRLLISHSFEYTRVETPVEVGSMTEAVALLSLSKHSLDGDYLTFDIRVNKPISYSPTSQMTHKLVMALFKCRLIQVSHESSLEAFDFDGSSWINSFFPTRCDWLLLPSNDFSSRRELIEGCQTTLSSGNWPEAWEDEIDSLWNMIALEECVAHLEELHHERNLDFESGDAKTIEVLRRALLNYSPAQVINLYWQSARDAVDYMAKRQIGRQSGQSVVRGILDRKIDKFLVNKWNLNPSRRDRRLPRSAVSVVFFDIVTGFGDDYFEEVPPISNTP